jgi:hypothetical protein
MNEISAPMAEELSRRLRLTVHDAIVQLNSVGHPGADGFTRLANQALFEGRSAEGRRIASLTISSAREGRWPI